MKYPVIAASLMMAASSFQFAQATSDGTISFTGLILDQTCTTNINGAGSNATVSLPAVSSTGMTQNSVKGKTALQFVLACQGSATKANVFFESGPTVNPAGLLTNTLTTGAATGIALQILDSDSSPVMIGSTSQTAGPSGDILSNMAVLDYSVQYIATGMTVIPGAYQSSVTYSINYQ